MRIARNHNLLPLKRCTHYHRFIPAGRTVYKKKTLIGTVKITQKCLRLADCPLWRVQIIRKRRLCHIISENPISRLICPPAAHSTVQPVSRNSKICRFCRYQTLHRFKKRRIFLFHLNPPFLPKSAYLNVSTNRVTVHSVPVTKYHRFGLSFEKF